MTRITLLIELAKAISDSSTSNEVKAELQDIRNKLLGNEISQEQAMDMITHGEMSNKIAIWFRHIKTKPIYKNIKLIIEDKLEDQEEIAKVLTSLLTQLVIQKQHDITFDYDIFQHDTIIDMIKDYFNGKPLIVSDIKNIFETYQKLEELNPEVGKDGENNV